MMNNLRLTILPIMAKCATITVRKAHKEAITNELIEINANEAYKNLNRVAEATLEDQEAAVPDYIFVVTYIVIGVLALLLAFNGWMCYRLKRQKVSDCQDCEISQIRTVDSLESIFTENDLEEAEETASDEDETDAESPSSSQEKPLGNETNEVSTQTLNVVKDSDTVSEDSVEVLFEIETLEAKNIVTEESLELPSKTAQKCHSCGKEFHTETTLSSHMLLEHPSKSMEESAKEDESILTTMSSMEVKEENVQQNLQRILTKMSETKRTNELSLPSNITSASTISLSNTANDPDWKATLNSLRLETIYTKMSWMEESGKEENLHQSLQRIHTKMSDTETKPTNASVLTNITSASTDILSNIGNDSNISNNARYSAIESLPSNLVSGSKDIASNSKVSSTVAKNSSKESAIVNNIENSVQDMFENSTDVPSIISDANSSSLETLETVVKMKRKDTRRRSKKAPQKNLLLKISCKQCDGNFQSEYSLGQHMVSKHN